MVGAFVGGTAWQLNNIFGFLYVSRVVTYNKIYGGLGLVPVFMAGLYFSWLILLFGAQVAYAFQNRKAYSQDKLVENVNQRGREFIALRLMAFIGERFQSGLAPATTAEISGELKIPSRLVQNILRTLITARLVVEVAGHETGYSPARPLEAINAHHILSAMRAAGQDLPRHDEIRAEVFGEFAKIEEAERDAASRVTLLALANRPKKQIENAAPKSKK
jgi:membrane protein